MENTELKTNHNVRILHLTTNQHVICIFAQMKNSEDDDQVLGYRLIYPFELSLGTPSEDGNVPINYKRWCPFSPVEEHRISGDHIISAVFPDNTILDSYVTKLEELGIKKEQIFFPEEAPEDGDNSEPAEAAE